MIYGRLTPINIVRQELLGSDSEGRAVSAVTAVQVQARVAAMSDAELALAASFGEAATGVACVDLGTDITDSDTIEVLGLAEQQLDGVWKVTAVRPTPAHLRVLLRRST